MLVAIPPPAWTRLKIRTSLLGRRRGGLDRGAPLLGLDHSRIGGSLNAVHHGEANGELLP